MSQQQAVQSPQPDGGQNNRFRVEGFKFTNPDQAIMDLVRQRYAEHWKQMIRERDREGWESAEAKARTENKGATDYQILSITRANYLKDNDKTGKINEKGLSQMRDFIGRRMRDDKYVHRAREVSSERERNQYRLIQEEINHANYFARVSGAIAAAIGSAYALGELGPSAIHALANPATLYGGIIAAVGFATFGIYYLARRHQAHHLREEFLQSTFHPRDEDHVDTRISAYPENFKTLVWPYYSYVYPRSREQTLRRLGREMHADDEIFEPLMEHAEVTRRRRSHRHTNYREILREWGEWLLQQKAAAAMVVTSIIIGAGIIPAFFPEVGYLGDFALKLVAGFALVYSGIYLAKNALTHHMGNVRAARAARSSSSQHGGSRQEDSGSASSSSQTAGETPGGAAGAQANKEKSAGSTAESQQRADAPKNQLDAAGRH
ncbi:MAG: hypothetical protein KGH78_01865 [Candidatus Micrarchaeota archaeon]|nr:hypothetical protein [Candidatus Micrarchaeota archaeon]